MKKIFALIVTATISFTSAFANNDLNKTNDTKPVASFQKRYIPGQDNWFASVGVGAQVYFGDHDKQTSVGKRITPKFEITAGKWLNQSFGVRINANMAKMKGLTQQLGGIDNGLSTGKKYRDSDGLWHQDFTYLNMHADFLFNWTNDAYGFDKNRMYNLIPYAGIGFVSALNKQKGTSFSPNIGVINSFKINDKFNIDLDVKGNLFTDKVDGEKGGRNFEGALSIMAGIKYSFK